jgi:hypothetical protein
MKKLFVLGLLFAMSAGCGRSWCPWFRGAPCNGLCSAPAPAMRDNCENCIGAAQSGYESYDDSSSMGQIIGSTTDGAEYIGTAPMNQGYQSAPMAPMNQVMPGTIMGPK